ncbi:hypothetical protein [Mesorhizobium waimense]|uniref:hypothetical protein n=1 Tax=Mesorhizobium waimense TaxID=1300307 RepID=UPI001FDFAD9A|nr:hypothetical protein [Mesorhizobium waimense]
MRLTEYVEYDATSLASLVETGEVTAMELARLARQAHDEVNPHINAVIEFYEDAETVVGADAGPSVECHSSARISAPPKLAASRKMEAGYSKATAPMLKAIFFVARGRLGFGL